MIQVPVVEQVFYLPLGPVAREMTHLLLVPEMSEKEIRIFSACFMAFANLPPPRLDPPFSQHVPRIPS